jgi:hypothetical protein
MAAGRFRGSFLGVAALVLHLALACVASTARADNTPTPSLEEQAAQIKARGDRAMDAGTYADALLAYREAYVVWPQVTLLYNMGRAEERLGLHADAYRDLESFARFATPELRTRVPRLNDLLAAVRSRITLVVVKTNVSGAKVLVRGRYAGSTPLRGPIPATPGKATIELHADGQAPVVRELVLEEGTTQSVDLTHTAHGVVAGRVSQPAGAGPSPAGPGAPEQARSRVTEKWWFWTGVAAAAMSARAVTAIALREENTPASAGDPGASSAALVKF